MAQNLGGFQKAVPFTLRCMTRGTYLTKSVHMWIISNELREQDRHTGKPAQNEGLLSGGERNLRKNKDASAQIKGILPYLRQI